MARETQLDTHEIDKLLADDDFIDDFDFSEDSSDQFVDAEGNLGGESEDESDDDFELDENDLEELPLEKNTGVVASEDELASVALEINDLDFTASKVGKIAFNVLKIAIGFALACWLAQFFGVIYLLKQPITIRDEIQSLVAETDLLQGLKPVSEMGANVVAELVVVANPAEPEIFQFNLYLPLYSLEGLKVFSVEVEVVQFQESGRLVGDGQKKMQESLRALLQEEIGVRLQEEIVDVKSHLSSLITPYIEAFFSERKVDLSKVKIRIHNPYVQ